MVNPELRKHHKRFMRRFMMKYFNFKIFALVVLVFPLHAIADIPINGSPTRRSKFTLFGHTGQDPVYKSIGGITMFVKPELNLTCGKTSLDDFHFDTISTLLSDSTNWINEEILNEDLGHLSNSHQFGMEDNNQSYGSLDSLPTLRIDSTLPAPPAFILVVAGFFGCTRRKN